MGVRLALRRNTFVLIGFLVGLGGNVYAQGGDDTIYACFQGKSGNLRVVDALQPCRNGEERLVWNIKGPRGPQGNDGTNGRNGSDGSVGPVGPAGLGVKRVLDVNDTEVGQLISPGTFGNTMYVTVDNQTFTVGGGPNGFSRTTTRLSYPTLDCSGPAYAVSPQTTPFPLPPTFVQPLMSVSGSTGYFVTLQAVVIPPPPAVPPFTPANYSIKDVAADGAVGACVIPQSTGFPQGTWAVFSTVDLRAFVPPFHVE